MNKNLIHLLLLHFNSLTGPEIIFSSEKMILDSISTKLRSIFDLNIEEHFFEITIRKENIKITNMFFEIPSELGRGRVEMLMFSVITDENYDTKLFQNILADYTKKIKLNPKIYKAFYQNSDLGLNINEIAEKKKELNKIMGDCLEDLKHKSSLDFEDEEIVKKFKKLSW